MPDVFKLTSYSHGSGCGCKISPEILSRVLQSNEVKPAEHLLVGNNCRDDAAAYDLGNGQVLLSTADFFMPIVDDAFDFGRIAAANAISDIYAMGGRPLLAIAILGWPVDKLPPEVAGQVMAGARQICQEAGISIAGGHSIDSPEPIFGLSVNGLVSREELKTNAGARVGDFLFLTKKLGVGILTTAEKKNLLQAAHRQAVVAQMARLNRLGERLAAVPGVTALTDVTGFGLFGHLLEMCEASQTAAEIYADRVLTICDLQPYLEQKAIPGGAGRNWQSYGHKIRPQNEYNRLVFSDPQTSGGLLIAVRPEAVPELQDLLKAAGLEDFCGPIGRILQHSGGETRLECRNE